MESEVTNAPIIMAVLTDGEPPASSPWSEALTTSLVSPQEEQGQQASGERQHSAHDAGGNENAPVKCVAELAVADAHLTDLRRSGLTDVTIRAAGFRSVDAAEARRILGYTEPTDASDWPGDGMVIPFHGCDGYCRFKPTEAAQGQEGTTAKYLTPRNHPNHVYIPPLPIVLNNLSNSEVPLIVTEGEKKSLRLSQEGFCAVGLVGNYGWKPGGEERLIEDFDRVALEGRVIAIIWDSDAVFNYLFADATVRFAKLLQARGAVVRLARLTPDKWPDKAGVDDWFVAAEATRGVEQARREFQAILDGATELKPSTTAQTIAFEELCFGIKHVGEPPASALPALIGKVMSVARCLAPTGREQIVDQLHYRFRVGKGALKDELKIAARNAHQASAGREEGDGVSLPQVCLPCETQSISACGAELGQLIAPAGELFVRGKRVVTVSPELRADEEHTDVTTVVTRAKFCSLAERYCRPVRPNRQGDYVNTVMQLDEAEKLLAADPFLEQLPTISVLTRCPVLVEQTDGTLAVITGYDATRRILACGKVEGVPLGDAIEMTLELFADTKFATEADRSRAVAALITPAMVFGGLLGGRAPIDLKEADESQAGKGYLHKITAAVYGDKPLAVTQTDGGVGSLEEKFNRALIGGHHIVSLENIRGYMDCPSFESFMTEDLYLARALRTDMVVVPARYVVMMTTNGASMPPDLANRFSPTRIVKQTDKIYPKFEDGLNLLEYVKRYQARYLGCVFAAIREWHRCGKPISSVTGHDFRGWAEKLDWIVQELFSLPPLVEGLHETKQRMTNPNLNFLRQVCIAIRNQARMDAWLRTNKIVDSLEAEGCQLPGLEDGKDAQDDQVRKNIFLTVGRKLGQCFPKDKKLAEVVIDQFQAKRRTENDGHHDVAEYFFTTPSVGSPDTPPDTSPDKAQYSPDSPDGCGIALADQKNQDVTSSQDQYPSRKSALGETGKTEGSSGESKASLEASAPVGAVPYRFVGQGDDLAPVAAPYLCTPVLGIDTETTGLDPLTDRLRLLQISLPDASVLLVDCRQLSDGNRELLQQILGGTSTKVFHNAKFDLKFLSQAGFQIGGPIFDTMLASQLLDAGLGVGGHKLQDVVRNVLGQQLSKELQASNWCGELTPEQLDYAARDAAVLLSLHSAILHRLEEAGLMGAARLEFDCVRVVAAIELAGMPLDAGRWEALRQSLAVKHEQADAVLKKHFLETNPNINLASPAQLLRALKTMGIEIESTNNETLTQLAKSHQVVRDLQQYRKAAKLAEAFGEKLPTHIHPATGRIHASYRQLGAATGRLSCSDPNLQQIPGKKEFRECFAAAPGNKLVIADYSQIELRVLAELSGDERMTAAFNEGRDLHVQTAALIAGKPIEQVTPLDRKGAKAVNFGLIFGMGANGLQQYALKAYEVELTNDQAAQFRRRYFVAYPKVANWQRHQVKIRYHKPWETRTLSGRRRQWKEEPKFTELCNTPIQGTAADIMKQGLALVHVALQGTAAKIIGTVHDEMIVEAPVARAGEVAAVLKKSLEEAGRRFLKTVPVVVEVSVGDSWAEKT